MKLQETYPIYLANQPTEPNHDLPLVDKYTGKTVSHVPRANRGHVEGAIAAAADAAGPMKRFKPWQRRDVLAHCAARFAERHEELAMALCIEAGKPLQHSRGEVARLIDTFRFAAGEAERLDGEVLTLDASRRADGYFGMTRRVPIGPCAFITPWNFPLNLVAHKVAPAIACGCPFVLKPASETPIGALIIGQVLAETDLPDGAFSVVTPSVDDAEPMVTDERIKLLSFTGSDTVGWDLKARAGKKKVSLELGGNAGCIVEPDVDLDDAVDRILTGTFYQSGQSCISVQRIYVHERIYDRFRDAFVKGAGKLKVGDPKDERTFVGPIISEDDAKTIEQRVKDAVDRGGRLLLGGERDGAMLGPTILDNVPEDAAAACEEIFGPVGLLFRYRDFDEALRRVDDSRFGLQAGVFTRDLFKAHRAWDRLDVGGVLINEVPSWRVDHMPYGGTKDSGNTREGLRYSIDEMTELRLCVIRGVD